MTLRPMSESTSHPPNNTISDFGAQWTRYRDNEGYYGSVDMLRDHLEGLLAPEALRGATAADVGSGTGRIVNMLVAAGAARVYGLEPSAAFSVLRENTAEHGDRVVCLNMPGEQLDLTDLDYIFSFGVLHHIEDPAPVVRRMFAALKPGGRCFVWLYGHEGNEAYLRWAQPLRRVTRRLPDPLLVVVCHALNLAIWPYMALCRWLPLPMREYMRGHFAKLTVAQRYLTLFDQMNPAYAKYYTREEAHRLLQDAGFGDVRSFHRHGYSWSVIGTKPGN